MRAFCGEKLIDGVILPSYYSSTTNLLQTYYIPSTYLLHTYYIPTFICLLPSLSSLPIWSVQLGCFVEDLVDGHVEIFGRNSLTIMNSRKGHVKVAAFFVYRA